MVVIVWAIKKKQLFHNRLKGGGNMTAAGEYVGIVGKEGDHNKLEDMSCTRSSHGVDG